MKFLQDYKEQRQTELFKKTQTFFAFNIEQFEQGVKENNIPKGCKIVHVGAGCFVPKEHEEELSRELELIEKEAIKQDIKENGIEEIIKRELVNYECYYTGRLSDCREALEGYEGVNEDLIEKIFNEERSNHANE